MNKEKREQFELEYAFHTGKKCEMFLDHNPMWCGDCYACGNCGLIFVEKRATRLAAKEERERFLEKIRKMRKTRTIAEKVYDTIGTESRFRGYNQAINEILTSLTQEEKENE